ncbi:MAG: FHA domain-containing protein [Gemmataceae bacterium]
MSFKLFVYYCALFGAWAAFLAWAFAQFVVIPYVPAGMLSTAVIAGVMGLFLGIGIGSVDAYLNATGAQRFARVGLSVAVGLVGGMISGLFGALIFEYVVSVRSFGWVLVGMTIGIAIGMFDMVRAFTTGQGQRYAIRKVLYGLIGGTVGGLVGGVLFDLLDFVGIRGYLPRSTLATNLVILGACIGLLIGLAQIIAKEAWLRVEAGFRPGRDLILSKPEFVIGRAEGCDLGIFGDNAVEKKHARILNKNNRFILEDLNTPSGTFINDERISGPTPLRSGDMIRLGKNVLRFEERQKRK